MGRTIPSFRIAMYQEEKSWRTFRSALDKKDRSSFDEMFLSARSYISACMVSCNPVRINPIMMAMVFDHYKQIANLKGDGYRTT